MLDVYTFLLRLNYNIMDLHNYRDTLTDNQ